MTDLTEQWKNGELEKDWYYVKGADGLFGIMPDYALYRVNLEHPDNTISLLASVPSYEEWQQLKELLKECRSPINHALCLNLSEEEKIEFKNLLAKIKQAIGEMNNGN